MNRKVILTAFLAGISFTGIFSQATVQQVVNVSGGTYSFGYTNVDWSVGEMSLVNTAVGTNQLIIVTNGFLQPFTTHSGNNTNPSFGAEEIKIFPNPSTTYIEINFLTSQKGKLNIRLYDALGQKVYEKQTYSNGNGLVEIIDMQRWAAAGYALHITLDPEAGSIAKKGSYKIIKVR